MDDGPRVAMEVLRLLDQHALVPTTFRLREPSLDDVFLALTGKRTEADDDERRRPRPTGDAGGRRRAPAGAGTDERRRSTMSTTTTAITPGVELAPALSPGLPRGAARLRWAVADTLTVTKRNLIAYTRIPESLFFSTLQPIMFVLLFRYVFGGAIHAGDGLSYIDFLMAGIFVQSVAFGGIGTAVGLAEDLQKGLIERFRALPMARSAVLAGRTTADLVRNVFVVLLMTGVGALVGFNFPNGALGFIAACRAGPALRLRLAVGVRRHRARRRPTARRRRSWRSRSSSH